MSDDTAGLRAGHDGTITLHLIDKKGKPFEAKVERLGPGDLAEAEEYLLDLRCGRQVRVACSNNLLLEGVREMHAKALALIQCTNVAIQDVLNSPRGRLKLCHLALNRASEEQLTLEETTKMLAPVDVDEFFLQLAHISGLYMILKTAQERAEEAKKTDPLGTAGATPTETPSPEQAGAVASLASATPTG